MVTQLLAPAVQTTALQSSPTPRVRACASSLITDAGEGAARRFLEFFTVNIRNPNTRRTYAGAAMQFLDWCEGRESPT